MSGTDTVRRIFNGVCLFRLHAQFPACHQIDIRPGLGMLYHVSGDHRLKIFPKTGLLQMTENGGTPGGRSQPHRITRASQPLQDLRRSRLDRQAVLPHISLKPIRRLLSEARIIEILPVGLHHNLPAVIGIQPDTLGKNLLHIRHAVLLRHCHPCFHAYNLRVKQDTVHVKNHRFHLFLLISLLSSSHFYRFFL